jgi:hypothetical protein
MNILRFTAEALFSKTALGANFFRIQRMTYVVNSQAPNRYIPTRQSVWVELCQLCGRLLPLLLSLVSLPLRCCCWLDIRPIQLRLRWSMITLFGRGIGTLGSNSHYTVVTSRFPNSQHYDLTAVGSITHLRSLSFFALHNITNFILRRVQIIKVPRNTYPLCSTCQLLAAALIPSYIYHQGLLHNKCLQDEFCNSSPASYRVS